jgi:hypothetical protein
MTGLFGGDMKVLDASAIVDAPKIAVAPDEQQVLRFAQDDKSF